MGISKKRRRTKLPDNIESVNNDGNVVLRNSTDASQTIPSIIIESSPMPKKIQDQIDAAFKQAAETRGE